LCDDNKGLLLAWDTKHNVISLITMVTKVYLQTDNQSKFIICEEPVMIHLTKKQLLLGLHSAKIQIFKTLPLPQLNKGSRKCSSATQHRTVPPKMQFSDATSYSVTQNAVQRHNIVQCHPKCSSATQHCTMPPKMQFSEATLYSVTQNAVQRHNILQCHPKCSSATQHCTVPPKMQYR
jgi:hypothetical protein